jgi:predicted ATPase
VRAIAEAEIALAEEHGFRERLAESRAFIRLATIELVPTEQEVAELEAAAAAITYGYFRIVKSAALAQLYLRVGRPDRAHVMLDSELARVERSGERFQEAELYRLKAKAILIRDTSAVAETETCFRKAIEIAKDQSAKWWELRATVDLARLLRDTNRRDEARGMLSEIYDWFTEGFDTADLRDAKTLLDELNQ